MFANFYTEQMADVDYKKIFNFLKPYIKPKDYILDAGCGPGYLLKELIDNNYDAIGVDIDEHMLSIAVNEFDLNGKVFIHDLRDPLKQKFNVILSVFDVINYFKGVKGVFQNIHRALEDDGIFIFDIYNRKAITKMEGYFEFCKNYEWETWTENKVINHEINVNNNRLFEIKQYGYELKYYTDVLEEIGFNYEVLDGPDKRKHYIVAKKNG